MAKLFRITGRDSTVTQRELILEILHDIDIGDVLEFERLE